ncbi:MAG TPA: DUF2490 domain-containing protein [Sphingomonadaceae bacterium]|jgi:hypothetical protein|nr:DUF2490 domain-containing protein [Sphingomonadaceae bacterium]
MPRVFPYAFLAVLVAVPFHAPAAASDDGFEFWINPSVSFELDGDTGVEIETAQRFRSASDGRVDTYYARFWLNQRLSDAVTVSGGAARRINDGGDDETRFLQQLSTKHGVLRTRLRLEQRLVDGSGRMGLRLRPRLGAAIPLDGRWSLHGTAELFLTLRSTSAGGTDGLTGFRTQLGASYALSDHVSLTVGYLRQQDIVDGAPDEVGHAPLVGIEWSL